MVDAPHSDLDLHKARLLRRLARLAPDVFARYQRGEFASIAAAWRRASIRPSPNHPLAAIGAVYQLLIICRDKRGADPRAPMPNIRATTPPIPDDPIDRMIMAFLLVAQPAQSLVPTDVLDAAAALTAHLIINGPGETEGKRARFLQLLNDYLAEAAANGETSPP